MATIPDGYLDYAQKKETGGMADPLNAQSTSSSASGPYQFTDDTSDAVREKHPELKLSEDWTVHPTEYQTGMKAFTQDNANALEAAGHPVDNNSLYLAHHYGIGGALKAYASDPQALVSDVFPSIMAANPDLRGKRIGDITGQGAKVADNNTDAAPALSSAAQVGPGVLVQGTAPDQSYDWRNRIGSAMSALVSGTNPAQAAAMNEGIKTDLAAKQAKTGAWSSFGAVDPKTGLQGMIHSTTGQIKMVQVHTPEDPASNAYDLARAKANSDLSDTIASDAKESRASLDQMQGVRAALATPGLTQGAGGDALQTIRKYASQVGMGDADTASAGDVVRAAASSMTLASRKLLGGMPGSLSDSDRDFLSRANVSLNNTPDANTRILDIYEKLHRTAIQREEDKQAYMARKENGGQLNDGFNTEQTAKYTAAHKAENDAYKAGGSVSPAAAAPRNALPKGVKSIQVISQ